MKLTGFYAYPSESTHLTETIETAIDEINKRNSVTVMSWRKTRIGGKIIIKEILNRIRSSDIVLCELSGLNPNVLFELGYAIGLRKRIWLTLDTTIATNSEQINSLDILRDFGYQTHTNHEELASHFRRDAPHSDLASHALRDDNPIIEAAISSAPTNDVFYLPSSVESSAVKRIVEYLSSLIQNNGRKIVIHDQLENSSEHLRWHLRNILETNSVIAHLDHIGSPGAQINNARCSMLAGMALGFNRNVRLIAPSPFKPPFDYRDLLIIYSTAKHCRIAVDKWLKTVFVTRIEASVHARDSELTLLAFRIGENIAENEELELKDYFVPTRTFSKGTTSRVGIFVGRKGTGKTASLFQLREYFGNERRNIVITIKPVGFRLAAFGRLIEEAFSHPEMAARFIERTWRAIIYAEMSKPLSRQIEGDTRYREPSDEEAAVFAHVEQHREFIEADFVGRIDIIRSLVSEALDRGDSPNAALHAIGDRFSRPLVRSYTTLFKRYQRVVILVDNLDKAWSISDDRSVQTQLIFGLLDFQHTIGTDLSLTEGDIRILVFLREDIFAQVITQAPEPDKLRLATDQITWSDRTQLVEILEKRFIACSDGISDKAIWTDLFCGTVHGRSTKDYLLTHVMPRPRDLIYVVQTAIDHCVSRSHKRIESDDLIDSLKDYYQFLLDNLFAEYGVYLPSLRDLMNSFSGSRIRQSRRQIRRLIQPYAQSSVEFVKTIEFLFRVSFIGIERNRRTKYAYTNDEAQRLIPVLRARLRWHGLRRTYFVIHPAFRAGLELSTKKLKAAGGQQEQGAVAGDDR